MPPIRIPDSLGIRRIHQHVMGCALSKHSKEKWIVRRQGQIEVSR